MSNVPHMGSRSANARQGYRGEHHATNMRVPEIFTHLHCTHILPYRLRMRYLSIKKLIKLKTHTPRSFDHIHLMNIGTNIYVVMIAQGIVSEANNTTRYFPIKTKVTDLKSPLQDLSVT